MPKFEQDGFPGCRQEDGKKDENPNAQKRSNDISIISFFRYAENIPTGKSNHRRMLKADWIYNGWHRRHMPMIH